MNTIENWFIYYRLSSAQALELAPRVRTMIDQLASATGVRGRVLRKDDVDGSTLLECYEGVRAPDQFAPLLAAALKHAQFPAALHAQRHIERFREI